MGFRHETIMRLFEKIGDYRVAGRKNNWGVMIDVPFVYAHGYGETYEKATDACLQSLVNSRIAGDVDRRNCNSVWEVLVAAFEGDWTAVYTTYCDGIGRVHAFRPTHENLVIVVIEGKPVAYYDRLGNIGYTFLAGRDLVDPQWFADMYGIARKQHEASHE